jgi:DNA-binding PadR family transcriptional regulator
MRDHISREIRLALWKIHILQHAHEGTIYGHWMLEELQRYGFRVSPGTLYPLLTRMEREGWLRTVKGPGKRKSPTARRNYAMTPKGARLLGGLRREVEELHRELVRNPRRKGRWQDVGADRSK